MKGTLVKILLFILNFVLWVCGILLIVFGSIALASSSTIISALDLINGVSNVTSIFDITPLLEGTAIFMIVLGCLLFLFGGIGCCGAFSMHKRTIMTYWMMLILGFLTELALIIYGAVYPPTSQSYIQQQMYSSLTQNFQPVTINSANGAITYSSETTANAWQELQAQTQCCGAYNNTDYSTFTWQTAPYVGDKYPPTCCTTNVPLGSSIGNTNQFKGYPACLTTANDLNTQGCYTVVMNMEWQFEYIAIIISACLMGAQFLGIILAVHTWHKMVREDGYY